MLLEYFNNYKWYAISGMLIINMISQIYKLTIYKQLTDTISNVPLNSILLDTLNIYFHQGITLFIIHFAQTIIKYILEKLITVSIKDLFYKLIASMMGDSNDFYKKQSGFDMTSKVNHMWTYLNDIENMTCKLLIDLPILITFMGYYMYMIYTLHRQALLFILSANVFIIFVLYPFSKKQYKLQQERSLLDTNTKHKLFEAVTNIEYVRLNNHESHEIQKICDTHNIYTKNKIYDKWISFSMDFISRIYNDFIILVIYSIGVLYITNKWLNTVDLMYLILHTGNFCNQLILLKDIYNYYIKMNRTLSIDYGNSEMVYNVLNSNIKPHLLNTQIDYNNQSSQFSNAIDTNNIIYKDITFSYDKRFNVISNLSFEFAGNKINLLLGPNGSGKSTLIKLLLRLYDLDDIGLNKNKIYFKGQDIKMMCLKELRNNITFVSQEPNIFNETVLYNIKYGNELISDEKIIELCDILYSRDWLLQNKNKLAGFRGRNLSGGEKKKIQLINAICKNANVIIFDEPTNTLDSTALIWFNEFIKLLRDKHNCTIILITHDIRLKDVCDKIIDLNKLCHVQN